MMGSVKDVMDEDSYPGSDDLVEYTLEEHEEELQDANQFAPYNTDETAEHSYQGKSEETQIAKNAADVRNNAQMLHNATSSNETNIFNGKFQNKVSLLPQKLAPIGAMKLLNSAKPTLASTKATTSYRLINADGTVVMNVAPQPPSLKKVISIANSNLKPQTNPKVTIASNARLVQIQPQQIASTSRAVVKTVTITKQPTNTLAIKSIPATAYKTIPKIAPGTTSSGQKTFVHMAKAGGQSVATASPGMINMSPTTNDNEDKRNTLKSNIITAKNVVGNIQQRYLSGIKGVQYVRVLNQQAPSGSSGSTKMIFQTVNKLPGGNNIGSSGAVGQSKIVLPNNRTYMVRNGTSKIALSAPTKADNSSELATGRKIMLGGIQSLEKLQSGATHIILKKEDVNLADTKPVGTVVAKQAQYKNLVTTIKKADSVICEDSMSIQQQPENSVAIISKSENDEKIIETEPNVSRKMNTTYAFPEEAYKKRPCNCTKSQCLKLYCDCFANGEFCYNCNCKDCYNTFEHENERQKAIRCTLERNPHAFKPKIGSIGTNDDGTRLHTKGCNCKRSGCLKNYCECYEAKIPCSSNCKCIGCRNTDQFAQEFSYFGVPDTSATSAEDIATRVSGKNNTGNCDENERQFGLTYETAGIKRSASFIDADISELPPAKQPHNFMTLDVIEATVQCMVAQADECLKRGCSIRTSERMILEEYGRCLLEIKEFAFRTDN